MGGTNVSSDVLTNLSQLLPTGTFLVFQALVPLFSNNGKCRATEKIMTGILVALFITLCFMLSFIDSITTTSGHVYYGFVTPWGLFNPQFKRSNIPEDLKKSDSFFTGGTDANGNLSKDYNIHFSDFVNGVLNVIVFCTLAGLTPPVSTCFYPKLPDLVARTTPVLVALVVGVFFVFVPAGRHGVGFALTASGFALVVDNGGPQQAAGTTTPTTQRGANPLTTINSV